MRATALTLVPLSLAALACSSETVTQGFEEPLRVLGGQFQEGELPGLPPLTQDDVAAGQTPVSPRVTDASGAGGVLFFGDPNRSIQGRASTDSVAVAFRFADLGNGYWITPVRSADPSRDGEYTWGVSAAFSRAIPPGFHTLLFAGVNAAGASGTQFDVRLCMDREVPDNENACTPTRRPPSLVVSLAWDTNVDLDLQVHTPGGVVVEAKQRTTAGNDEDPSAPGTGVLEHDSNSGCVIDGLRRENLVFQDPPPSGAYYVYANLFDACGEQATHFTLTLHTPAEGAPSEAGAPTFKPVETYRTAGALVASQANGGAKIGMYLTRFIVP